MTSKKITTDELDFDKIKSNLKEFLRDQSTLADYDFDGSVMSVLLDVLSYNTHYNSLYTNMAINEMFMDSASKRNSVISLAKLMGYKSKSITSARSKITITAVPPNTYTSSVFTIPTGTVFGTAVGDQTTVRFVTHQDVTATRINSSAPFVFTNVELIEGTRVKISYVAAEGVNFVVPQRNADMSTLKVRIYENSGSTLFTVFNPAESILNTTGDSSVYFVKQREDQFYELYFGNDVFGKAISDGNVVSIEYLISSGEVANKANTFVYANGADSSFSYFCTTTQAAQGGAPEETIESIRYNAPRTFVAQNRAVTASDYAALLYSSYPTIETLHVWGGQENIPPIYGKVFIAAKPVGRDYFTDSEKQQMVDDLLTGKSMVTVKPEFVDPKFLDVVLNVNAYYDPTLTVNGTTDIKGAITSAVTAYGTSLGKFDTSYRHSKMTKLIDASDASIVSSINTITIRYAITPIFNTIYNYAFYMGNPISSGSDATVRTTRFFHQQYSDRCLVKNDGRVLKLYTESEAGDLTYQETVGYFNTDGNVVMNELNVVGLYDSSFQLEYTPYSFDVIPINNHIVRLNPALSTINVISESQNHIFSGSR
jgi:hypothetical protein